MANIPETREIDPIICERCAEQGPTCCRLDPGMEEFCFPVSVKEWERILDHAGEKGSFVQEANSSNFVDNIKRLFPRERELVDKLFPWHKFHLRLATDKQGGCVFLNSEGCTLPREARPYYCRVFPFWVTGNRINVFTPATCLAVKAGKNLRGIRQAMGISEAEIRDLHGRLRMAWGLPPREGMALLEQSFTQYTKIR
ncbi:MAG: zinc/iron-chelating domain-containing protein [Desulfovibrio sp.]|nr:MAG: zinc/iron-chelating domain-containing protein [Desulfovibrio sp.]